MAGLEYNSVAPWPTGPFDKEMTLELKDPNVDLNNPLNWFEGCVGGSPGVAYIKCTTGITASVENNKASLYPNPATDKINIVLPSAFNGQDVTIRLYDRLGKQVKTLTESYAGQKQH